MKRLAHILLLAALACGSALAQIDTVGQVDSVPSSGNGVQAYTVATLPTPGSSDYQAAIVYDGASGSDCTTGGGTIPTIVLCTWNGSAWAYAGSVAGSGLAEPAGNGVVIRTGSGTTTNRTITGTANEVEVTNGDGVSGNPVVGLPATINADTTGNAATATALAANGANCPGGQAPLGVDASGAVEGCFTPSGTPGTDSVDQNELADGANVVTAGAGEYVRALNGGGFDYREFNQVRSDIQAASTSHASTHESGGSDEITELDSGLATTTHAANTLKWRGLRHATDCTAITDGVDGEVCWEQDANTFYVCESPEGAAGSCDAAGEWTALAGGGGSGYATIEDEGSALTQRTTLNFIGANVSCVDNAGGSQTDCTISDGASGTHITYTVSASEPTCNSGAQGNQIWFDSDGDDQPRWCDGTNWVLFGHPVKLPQVKLADNTTTVTSSDTEYVQIPSELVGWHVEDLECSHVTVGAAGTGNTTVDLDICSQTVSQSVCGGTVTDISTTDLTIDTGELSSASATTAAVLNKGATFAARDWLRIQTTATETTGTAPQGLRCTVELAPPNFPPSI